MPHNPWGSSARRPCARWHPPAIGGQSHSCRVTNHVHASTGSARTEPRPLHHTKVRIQPRNAPHSTVRALSLTFALSLSKAILTVRLEPHNQPSSPFATFPFALSLSKGGRELCNSHVFARTSTGSARTEPRPRHHTKFRIQRRNAPTQPFDRSITKPILTVRLEPHETPTLPFALSLSKGQRELRNSHPFPRTSTGSARTEPRPLHHTKVRIQRRNAPTQPFDRHHKKQTHSLVERSGNSATRTYSLMLRQAQHERSHGLATTRKFAFSLAMPPLNRSTGASQKRHPHRSPGASRGLTKRLPHRSP